MKPRMMMCPAVMLAKSRTISTKGLVKMPMNSTKGIMGRGIFSHQGTPGVLTMSFQYSLLPENWVMKKVKRAKIPVTAMLPVRLAPPGKMGMMPIRLFNKIKKNNVSKYGVYLAALSPNEGLITSSWRNTTTGSISPCRPRGASLG